MLKLNISPIKEDLRFTLPEAWHDKLVEIGKIANCPYEFVIKKIYKDASTKSTYYICEGEKKDKAKKKIAIAEYALKYLLAQEVPDLSLIHI